MSRPSDEQLAAFGASLREIDPSTLAPDEDGQPVRWFRGDGGAELFVWGTGEELSQAQLVFARVTVEWDKKRGLTTGSFAHGGAVVGGRYDPYLISVRAHADLEVVRSALRLLGASKVDPPSIAPFVRAMNQALAQASGEAPQ